MAANISIGGSAIDFSLTGTDGERYSLGSFKDRKALAVIFSCVHCPYVLAWEDRLTALQKEYADRSVAFVLINANDAVKYPQDSLENMKKHAAEKAYPFPFVHDQTQEVARAYGAERTPEIFLFDSGRRLAYHGVVDDNYENPDAVTRTYFRDAIEAVLAGKPAPTPWVAPQGCTIKWK
jgi:peroxiredoxin